MTGTLRGFDQFMNLVLDNTVEQKQQGGGAEEDGTAKDVGMVVIRGNSVVMVECLEAL